jgi:hypothetical protein
VSREQLRSKVAVTVQDLYANKTTSGSLLNANRPSAGGSPFISLASIPTDLPPVEKPVPAASAAPVEEQKQNPLQAAAASVAESAESAVTSLAQAVGA